MFILFKTAQPNTQRTSSVLFQPVVVGQLESAIEEVQGGIELLQYAYRFVLVRQEVLRGLEEPGGHGNTNNYWKPIGGVINDALSNGIV